MATIPLRKFHFQPVSGQHPNIASSVIDVSQPGFLCKSSYFKKIATCHPVFTFINAASSNDTIDSFESICIMDTSEIAISPAALTLNTTPAQQAFILVQKPLYFQITSQRYNYSATATKEATVSIL
ncbi:MAG: hypothetical protein HGA37_00035 [Lentimicrobium sp.]|nr:hypothetical protein [Lentimicrobium sp.]